MLEASQRDLSQFVWSTRYRDSDARPAEQSIEDTWKRVAAAVAAVEREPPVWQNRFLSILRDFGFLPAGRILAGAGTRRQVTLFNCFVMGAIEDSLEGIFEALKEGALTMQQGGGVGYDFSTLRPRGSRAPTTGMIASGPVSFLHVWDAMCATVLATGARRGAMMATLRCDHPDIEEFVDAKRTPGVLRHFNLSVLVSDAFLKAVKDDAEWLLVFPERHWQHESDTAGEYVQRAWSGSITAARCRVRKVVRARALWDRLCESAYDSAELGVLFIDRINARNNLAYCETLSATNPCGEEPLPPYGACNLGSLNLTAFVIDAFTADARIDYDSVRDIVRSAVRFLDNVIEISRFPLFRQREQVHRSRRIGLGITGLADALVMLSLAYNSDRARATASQIMQTIRDAAYEASTELAKERGAFPAFEADAYLSQPFIRTLPSEIQSRIRRFGIRNSHLTAIAPAGSVSLLAHGVSSGIEPIFGLEALHRVLREDGTSCHFQTTDYAFALWRSQQTAAVELPPSFVNAAAVSAHDQLLMQAALQPYVDGAISRTIALPRDCRKSEVQKIFESAFELGLKGCTVFRTETRPRVVFERFARDPMREPVRGAHCCDETREGD